jgi:ERCC4-type nuclease
VQPAAASPAAARPQGPADKLNIVIDSREQAGWTFEPRQVLVHRKALSAGDYSLLGLEDRVAIERKSLGDLVDTVIRDWLRFKKELVRLSGFDVACIAVEADIGQVYRHEYLSEALPASVLGRVNSIFIDHAIPTFWWGDKRTAADMCHRLLLLTWRRLSNELS